MIKKSNIPYENIIMIEIDEDIINQRDFADNLYENMIFKDIKMKKYSPKKKNGYLE